MTGPWVCHSAARGCVQVHWGLPKQKASDTLVRCHWHVLHEPPERNVLKILKIASKEILLSDGKTDVLMISVALSQKNSDK